MKYLFGLILGTVVIGNIYGSDRNVDVQQDSVMSEKVTENDAAVIQREQAIASLLELVLDFKDNDTTGAQCDDDLLNASIAFAIHGYEIQACCDAISKISLECQNKMIETLDNVR